MMPVAAKAEEAPPVNSAPPAIQGVPVEGQLLKGATGSWTGTQPLSFTYKWDSCNSVGKSCSKITGATELSYRVPGSEAGATLELLVTAKNSVGKSVAKSTATSVVMAANEAPPSVSGFDQVGDMLTSTEGRWRIPSPTITYQWERCTVSGCTTISGATASTYLLGGEDAGHSIRVAVTATGTAGEATATSNSTPEIEAKPLGPDATVYNSSGQPIVQYGAFYGNRPGSQIQMAENFAQCGNAEECPISESPEAPAHYPRVGLEPGVYHVLAPFGRHPYPQCADIFAYSDVALEGSTSAPGSVIEDSVPANGNSACPGMEVTGLVIVAANPGNVNETGQNPKVTNLVLHVHGGAEYGLMLDRSEGGSILVQGNTVTEAGGKGAAILVGRESLPVTGVGSPAEILNNTVSANPHEGIVVNGSGVRVAGNTVTSNTADIAIFGPSAGDEVAGNTVSSSYQGISLDGTEPTGTELAGNHNSVYNNTITETCVGVVLYKQWDDNVAGNYEAEPSREWSPPPAVGCASYLLEGLGNAPSGTRQMTGGIIVKDSWNNFIWTNQIWNFEYGTWLINGGKNLTVEGRTVGTTDNYFGRVPDYGQPWPWPVSGNWMNNGRWGMVVRGSLNPSPYEEYNEFVGNAVDGSTNGCYYEVGEIAGQNTGPANCN
jgi:parallel beta-helix repeat protein